MRLMLFLSIVILFVVCSCGGLLSNDDVQKSIPGVYIRFSQHEYGSEYDTIMIILQNKHSSEYKIVRKWKYERVLDGLNIEPEYKTSTTVGIYNTENKILEETLTGSHFSFDIDKGVLFKGSTEYNKIK